MGVSSSKDKKSIKYSDDSSSSSSDDESTGDFDFSIPYDLIVDVLSFVPSKDLITQCRLVCKIWKNIIDGHSLWKIKCQRENKFIPSHRLEKIPTHYYRLIYLHNPYGVNLLTNTCGENGLNDWVLVRNSGDGFAIEDPPCGADNVPSEVGLTSCFATSFSPCQKYQLIDLVERGIHPDVLDLPDTKIEVGEWYASRFDCACVYKIQVILLNDNYNKLSGIINFDACTVKEFKFEHTETQFTGREWRKISHTFENIGTTRYIFFEHFGKDDQFWAGHYGSKMTGAYAKVIV